MISLMSEQLTAQFYEWEILGRGWLYANEPVDLEPPFTPFFGHYMSREPIIDDGLRHTLLSSIVSVFQKKKPVELVEQMPEVSYDLFPFDDDSALVALKLIIPKETKTSLEDTEQLLSMLLYCTLPISFEIIGTFKEINIQFVCRETDVLYIKSQLVTFFRDISVLEIDINQHPLIIEETPVATIDFGLLEEFMRPLSQGESSIDSFTGMFSILEHLREGEQAVFQILFNGVKNHWQSSIIRAVSDGRGEPFFLDAPDMLPLAQEKVGSTLLAANIRLLAQAAKIDDSFALLKKLAFVVVTNSKSESNMLLSLTNET